jgi:hypothetical protein
LIVSSLVTLIVIVVGAFVASTRFKQRGGYGLISGAEYLLLGALMGPFAVGLVDEEMLGAVRPAMTLATAWMGLLFGLRLRRRGLAELGLGGALSILVEAGGTLAAIAFGLPLAAQLGERSDALGRGPAALGIAVVAAASTKSTLQWARTRLGASGRTTSRLDAITRHDDIVNQIGLVALATLFPTNPGGLLAARPLYIAGAVVGLGVLLGVAFTMLSGRRPERDSAWVLLIGVMLLGSGLATRLGLPAMTVGFLTGATISATTLGYDLFDQIAVQTERPVAIVLLLIVGVRLAPVDGVAFIALAAVTLRLITKLAVGPLIGPPYLGGVGGGAGLLGFGGLALATGAQIDLLYDGRDGALVLAVSAALAVVGDLTGPLALRALLTRRGEVLEAPRVDEPLVEERAR